MLCSFLQPFGCLNITPCLPLVFLLQANELQISLAIWCLRLNLGLLIGQSGKRIISGLFQVTTCTYCAQNSIPSDRNPEVNMKHSPCPAVWGLGMTWVQDARHPAQVGQSVGRELEGLGEAAQMAWGLASPSGCLSEIPREENEEFLGAEPSRQ